MISAIVRLRDGQIGTSQHIVTSDETVWYPALTFCVWHQQTADPDARNFGLPEVFQTFWQLAYSYLEDNEYVENCIQKHICAAVF